MYQYESVAPANFNIVEAYEQIAGAAFRLEAEGHKEIWIYLIDNRMEFHTGRFPIDDDCLVAHYKCHKVTHGFSSSDWTLLGRRIAFVYFSNY